MALDLAELKIRLKTADATRLTDDEGNQCLTQALRQVNRSTGKPSYDKTLVTVADQQEYTLPSGIREENIIDVTWNTTIVSDLNLSVAVDEEDFDDAWGGDETAILDDAQTLALLRNSRGQWRILNGKLLLIPTPTDADDPIWIEYMADFASATALPVELQEPYMLAASAFALEMMAGEQYVKKMTDGTDIIEIDSKAMMDLAKVYRDRSGLFHE